MIFLSRTFNIDESSAFYLLFSQRKLSIGFHFPFEHIHLAFFFVSSSFFLHSLHFSDANPNFPFSNDGAVQSLAFSNGIMQHRNALTVIYKANACKPLCDFGKSCQYKGMLLESPLTNNETKSERKTSRNPFNISVGARAGENLI